MALPVPTRGSQHADPDAAETAAQSVASRRGNDDLIDIRFPADAKGPDRLDQDRGTGIVKIFPVAGPAVGTQTIAARALNYRHDGHGISLGDRLGYFTRSRRTIHQE